jgi:RNA polymerase sigma-70 factor (ECF subfamily)
MTEHSELAETAIGDALQARDMHAAARQILAHCGADVLGFLVARLHSPEEGREAFATFSEDLWRGLPSFEHRCSVRCWAYTLARNAANRQVTRVRRPGRYRPLSEHPSVLARAAAVASRTSPSLRTDVKQRVRALRERLAVEDQTLLMLHVDRGLPWRELAQVLRGKTLGEPLLEREILRVRKRFERIKRQLRKLAIEDGLLEG